ncbi:MAG: PEP-CTERM-box response regulator transcription factor [Candidatus Methylomirabilota bacterium]|nr:PEP-CTERM-box response regulator transcription factor [Candidatus Methylomirabilis sp.]PWB46578.1 MAG: PEP-CTERM-box response regulator transcription factor [candidate division NC10 bacterium]
MTRPSLLIVDDDAELRGQLRWALAQEYDVLEAGDGAAAIEQCRRGRPVVVMLDLGLPPAPNGVEEGFRTLGALLEIDRMVKVVIATGQAARVHAIRAIDQGAYDFFYKPVQIDELKVVLRRAFHLAGIEREIRGLQQQLHGEPFSEMLGRCPQMERIFAVVRKVADTDLPVLIIGESGTGKELVARAIHRLSVRQHGPFVPINCGAIPETLLESELFGHEKGAFTGAHIQRKGQIEQAQGGTLFLDEVGELSLPLQVKLLRFLQERRFARVGGRDEIVVDTRILAATNSDLKQAMESGHFREDLYYRLGVVVVSLPPLRERGEDLLILAASLLARYAAEYRKPVSGFTPQALHAVEAHPWPGNVRELENRIKRAVVMTDGPRLTAEDLELVQTSESVAGNTLNLKEAREVLDRRLVREALTRSQGNMTQTAAALGISRPTLYELMERLGIAKEDVERKV